MKAAFTVQVAAAGDAEDNDGRHVDASGFPGRPQSGGFFLPAERPQEESRRRGVFDADAQRIAEKDVQRLVQQAAVFNRFLF